MCIGTDEVFGDKINLLQTVVIFAFYSRRLFFCMGGECPSVARMAVSTSKSMVDVSLVLETSVFDV